MNLQLRKLKMSQNENGRYHADTVHDLPCIRSNIAFTHFFLLHTFDTYNYSVEFKKPYSKHSSQLIYEYMCTK